MATFIKVNDCLLKGSSEWLEASNAELGEACEKEKVAEDKKLSQESD